MNTASKISRTRQHIAFSQRCRRYQLLPRSLTVKPLVPTPEGRRVAARAGWQFMSARVSHCYGELRRLETDLFFQKRQLEHVFSSRHAVTIEEHKNAVQYKVSNSSKERQKKKFDALLARQASSQKNDSRHVVNLSSKRLTDPQVSALSRASDRRTYCQMEFTVASAAQQVEFPACMAYQKSTSQASPSGQLCPLCRLRLMNSPSSWHLCCRPVSG